jgi:hypothetical protein
MQKSKTIALALGAGLLLSVAVAQHAGPGGQGHQGPGGPGHHHQGTGGPQHGPMHGPGLPPLMMLLHHEPARAELGITEEQMQRIHEAMQGSQHGPPQGGAQASPPDRKAMLQHMQLMDDKIRAILSQSQNKRATEIRIQMAGLMAAFDSEIQQKIGVTAEQKRKLEALVPKGPGGPGGPGAQGHSPGGPPPGGQGGFGPPQGGPPGGQGGFQRGPGGPGGPGGEHRKQLEVKITEILTEGQKDKLKALGGKPFQHKPE